MKNMDLLKYVLLFAAILIPNAHAQSFITSASTFNGWLTVIVLGMVLSSMLIGIYYMMGYLMNNQRAKAGARTEFVKLIAAVIVVVIVIAVFNYFGYSLLFTNEVSQVQMTNICNQLSNAKIDFISSNTVLNTPLGAVCANIIVPSSKVDPVTRNIDYGLGAVYVIEDNLTNQSAESLNAVYMLSTMLAFLRNYQTQDSVCFPIECLIPDVPSIFQLTVSASVYAGYQVGGTVPSAISVEAQLMFYFFLFQLILIILMLLLWPYLLAAGLIFESTMFTRRLGGLLIAIVVSSMLVYPTIYLFEYSSLNNIQNLQPLGASAVPGLALCGAPAGGAALGTTPLLNGDPKSGVYCYTSATQLPLSYIYKVTLPDQFSDMVPNAYIDYPANTMIPACPSTSSNGLCFIPKSLNFFVFPKIEDILELYFTWPAGGNLLSFEALFIIPGVSTGIGIVNAIASLTSLLSGNFIGSFPSFVYYYVDPSHTIAALLALINVYAIDAVVGFILPIFNILILLSSIIEISKLLGGEGSILGLEKFI